MQLPRPSPEPRPPTQRWLCLEPGAEPGPRTRRAARAAGPAPAPQPRCPGQDGRARTLTVGDVTEPLGVQQVPQPRHLILQLADQLVVGVLVDDGVTADLLGPVRVPGRQRGAGGCAARRPRAPGAPPAPSCRGISDRESPGPLTYGGLATWGNRGPGRGRDGVEISPHGEASAFGLVVPGGRCESNLHSSPLLGQPRGQSAEPGRQAASRSPGRPLAGGTFRHACPPVAR